MKKEKQIEEMARDIHFATCNDYISYSECEHIAKQLTDKRYRKEQEVAREIFDDIVKLLIFNTYEIACISKTDLAELKKKYIGE